MHDGNQKRRPGRPSAADIAAEVSAQDREIEVAYGTREQRLDEVDAKFGGWGFEYNADQLIGEIRGAVRDVAESSLEIGRRLVLIKEHEAHGNFMDRLEELGFNQSTSNKLMRAAITAQQMGVLRISPPPENWSGSNSPPGANFPGLTTKKLLEIAWLDDGDLEDLGEGGTVAGLTLDEIDRMSVREVRSALREEKLRRREETSLREDIIAKKEEKISDLERQLRGLPPISQAEINRARLKELYDDMLRRCFDIRSSIRSLSNVIHEARTLPQIDLLDLNAWASKVVDDATSFVLEDWEETMLPLDEISPLDEQS